MNLEVQVGTPPEPGRYVVWTACRAVQIRDWCEPSIASWHDGRWHSYEPIVGWIGPLPLVTHKECLKKIEIATGEAFAGAAVLAYLGSEREYDL